MRAAAADTIVSLHYESVGVRFGTRRFTEIIDEQFLDTLWRKPSQWRAS